MGSLLGQVDGHSYVNCHTPLDEDMEAKQRRSWGVSSIARPYAHTFRSGHHMQNNSS
jgi:hypothetical protein